VETVANFILLIPVVARRAEPDEAIPC